MKNKINYILLIFVFINFALIMLIIFKENTENKLTKVNLNNIDRMELINKIIEENTKILDTNSLIRVCSIIPEKHPIKEKTKYKILFFPYYMDFTENIIRLNSYQHIDEEYFILNYTLNDTFFGILLYEKNKKGISIIGNIIGKKSAGRS